MDPQKLSQLDPKLREAYQRVMGTPIPAPQAAPVQAQTPPPPPTPDPTPVPPPMPVPEPEPTAPAVPMEPPVQPPTQPAIPTESPAVPTPEPAIHPPEPPAQTSNFVQMNSEVAAVPSSPNFSAPIAQAQTVALKKKNGIMLPILFGIVGLVFIGLYTLFWTKIFNFKLPFLP